MVCVLFLVFLFFYNIVNGSIYSKQKPTTFINVFRITTNTLFSGETYFTEPPTHSEGEKRRMIMAMGSGGTREGEVAGNLGGYR